MKPFPLALTLAVTVGAIGAHASSLSLTLTPANGAVAGSPGNAVGWGFTLTDTSSDWIVLDDSFFTGSPVYGTYTDYIVNQFYVAGPAPESADIVSPWNPLAQTGTGEFDLYATDPGDVSFSGTISVDYTLFSEDPNNPNFDPDSFISNGTFTNPVSISTTPEPPTWALMIMPFMALLAASRRRRLCPQL
jgi:hypothetical protein